MEEIFLVDQHVGVFKHRFLGLRISEVRADVALVKLEAFDEVDDGFEAFAFAPAGDDRHRREPCPWRRRSSGRSGYPGWRRRCRPGRSAWNL